MEPSPEPPPLNSNPNETTPISTDLPPDVPTKRTAFRVTLRDPDPIRAVTKDYFPSRESLGTYAEQLKDGLQTLAQGPLDYRLAGFLTSWRGSELGVRQTEFENAAQLVITMLDAGLHSTSKLVSPLGAEDWGTLASACLAATARGFTSRDGKVWFRTLVRTRTQPNLTKVRSKVRASGGTRPMVRFKVQSGQLFENPF
jgi:hypothetical protein